MKRGGIIALVVIAVAVSIIITTFSDTSTYESFATAKANPGTEYHVVGELVKDKEQYYDPIKDPNYFSFFMRDSLDNVMKVILHDAKPTDIERSEKVVVIGKAQNESEFHADKILQKCPSKYTPEEVAVSDKPE